MPVEQAALTMSDRVGSIIYRAAKDQAAEQFGSTDSEEARLWLKQQSIAIKRSLHGYDTGQGFQRMEPEAELALVAQALPEAPDSDVTRAIDELVKAHDEANELAVAAGVSNYYQSATAQPIRDQIMTKIDEITSTTPEAQSVADLMMQLMRSANQPSPQGMMSWGDEGFGSIPSATSGMMSMQQSSAPLSI